MQGPYRPRPARSEAGGTCEPSSVRFQKLCEYKPLAAGVSRQVCHEPTAHVADGSLDEFNCPNDWQLRTCGAIPRLPPVAALMADDSLQPAKSRLVSPSA